MKIVKKINNNVAVGIDNDNRELIVFGRGVGFPKVPYELNDMGKVERTFYGVSNYFLKLIKEIPEKYFSLSVQIIDFGRRQIESEFSPNIVFTLADHIAFAIERCEKGICIDMPFSYDIQFLYENEMKVGEYAVRLISKKLNVSLDKKEAFSIALHFINAENLLKQHPGNSDSSLISDVVSMVEEDLEFTIDKNGFNYSRFITHLQYLLKRILNNEEIKSKNLKMFDSVREEMPDIYQCVIHISSYLKEHLDSALSDEECLYLMLHISRLYSREEH